MLLASFDGGLEREIDIVIAPLVKLKSLSRLLPVWNVVATI